METCSEMQWKEIGEIKKTKNRKTHFLHIPCLYVMSLNSCKIICNIILSKRAGKQTSLTTYFIQRQAFLKVCMLTTNITNIHISVVWYILYVIYIHTLYICNKKTQNIYRIFCDESDFILCGHNYLTMPHLGCIKDFAKVALADMWLLKLLARFLPSFLNW